MTDWLTDELFALPRSSQAITVRYPVSRLVVDPERFENDEKEPMAKRGMGVIYTLTSERGPLRHPPTPDERRELLERFYQPHHRYLTEAVTSILGHFGKVLIVDCHSFSSRPLPHEPDQQPSRPDICLGTDSYHTPLALLELAKYLFIDAGFSVEIDRPFGGALVPMEYFGNNRSVASIMVEINRGLYLDEATGRPLPAFPEIAEKVQAVVNRLIEFFDSQPVHSSASINQ
jgi:N-formylglutamate amidohydrolase